MFLIKGEGGFPKCTSSRRIMESQFWKIRENIVGNKDLDIIGTEEGNTIFFNASTNIVKLFEDLRTE
jgi:hypothetical protein